MMWCANRRRRVGALDSGAPPSVNFEITISPFLATGDAAPHVSLLNMNHLKFVMFMSAEPNTSPLIPMWVERGLNAGRESSGLGLQMGFMPHKLLHTFSSTSPPSGPLSVLQAPSAHCFLHLFLLLLHLAPLYTRCAARSYLDNASHSYVH
jgi:hypothetical protein